jgi:hypothetical protein
MKIFSRTGELNQKFLTTDITNVTDGKNKLWFHSSNPRLTPFVQSVSYVVNFI